MRELPGKIAAHAEVSPQCVAIDNLVASITYAQLIHDVYSLSSQISRECTGILLGNGIEWVICDLALLNTSTCNVPLPVFFSNEQIHHVIQDAGIKQIITDNPKRISDICTVIKQSKLSVNNVELSLVVIDNYPVAISDEIVKYLEAVV